MLETPAVAASSAASDQLATDSAAASAIVPEYWSWQANERVKHAERVLSAPRWRPLATGEQVRIDEPAPRPLPREMATPAMSERKQITERPAISATERHPTPRPQPLTERRTIRIHQATEATQHHDGDEVEETLIPASEESSARLSLVGWFFVCASVSALTCSTLLMVWSVQRERPDLWRVGLPIMIFGQVGLILGIGLQLVARTDAEQREAARVAGTKPSRSATRETQHVRD